MFETVISQLKSAERVGIFAHENPDGDAMGSAYSLKLALLGMGKYAEVFLSSNPDAAAYGLIRGKEASKLVLEDCDLFIAVDCAESSRLGQYEKVFLAHPNTGAIDHHITHRPFAKETVVQNISSCCELMAQLYEEMGTPVTVDMANDLYLGIVTDTGNFKYSSVTPDTLRRAAALMEQGADFSGITKIIFDTKSREYYRLMRIALERLKFYEDGRVCVLYLAMADFQEAGLAESEAGPIVSLPGTVLGVDIGIYIRERDENGYKISLRSSGNVDVARVALAFGGGGHVRASGYNVSGRTVSEIIEEVLIEIRKQLKEEHA